MFTIPTIPVELLPDSLPPEWDERTNELWEEILAELADETFFWQAHYKRQTFDNGCRGPLCSKFIRDASRSRPRSNQLYAPRADRIYDPIIDYFKIIALKRTMEKALEFQKQLKEIPHG